jgi:hypothetical protein
MTYSNVKTTYDIKRRLARLCIRSGLDSAGEQSISPAYRAGVYLEMIVEGDLRAQFPNDLRLPAILAEGSGLRFFGFGCATKAYQCRPCLGKEEEKHDVTRKPFAGTRG